MKGYAVTIFEAESVPGGMLKTAIPDHRLPGDVLMEDIENIFRRGVELRTNRTLGKDFVLDDLFRDGFEAVFIATGAHASMKMAVPGEEAVGVIQGIKLLRDVHLGREVELGRRVGVIGGGNAAIDAARVALRHKGCESPFFIGGRVWRCRLSPKRSRAPWKKGWRSNFSCPPLRSWSRMEKS